MPQSTEPAPDTDNALSPRGDGMRHGRVLGDEEPPERKRWVGPALAVGLAMGAAAIATLVLTGMQDQAIYSKPVDQLLAQKAKFVGRPVRAEGNLVHGTLVKRDLPCEYRFSIAKGGSELPVRFAQCVVPDTFRDVPNLDVGVTVEGELHNDDTFEATSVLAKCPSKYEMEQRKQQGDRMPHAPLASGAEVPRLGTAMRQP
ncbi:MAG: cytochrome c maturation protein CcmE [Myxococcota bacterium]|nr:cytochrome c maturation protein CcmE [Myxococcota bacterium]